MFPEFNHAGAVFDAARVGVEEVSPEPVWAELGESYFEETMYGMDPKYDPPVFNTDVDFTVDLDVPF